MSKVKSFKALQKLAGDIRNERKASRKVRILVHMGTCCIAAGSTPVLESMQKEVANLELDEKMDVMPGGCSGLCYAEPTVAVCHPDGRVEYYGSVDIQQGRMIVNRCLTQSPVLGLNQVVPGWELTEAEGSGS